MILLKNNSPPNLDLFVSDSTLKFWKYLDNQELHERVTDNIWKLFQLSGTSYILENSMIKLMISSPIPNFERFCIFFGISHLEGILESIKI